MAQADMSKRKAHAISNGVFLISLAILYFTGFWWPGILLAIWATLALRQQLTGRKYDVIVTSVILLGLFISALINLEQDYFFPVLFVVGGLYLITREYFFESDTNGEEKSEEIKEDVEINQD